MSSLIPHSIGTNIWGEIQRHKDKLEAERDMQNRFQDSVKKKEMMSHLDEQVAIKKKKL